MPVLSTQAWRLSQQRLTEEEQIQLHKELETCIEVAGTIRNSVESYMTEKAIRHIEELDYPYRQEYENWLNSELTRGTKVKYLTGFDLDQTPCNPRKSKYIAGKKPEDTI